MKSALSFSKRNRERGAATLVVVMVLFFIISMVAAYTSRNLIFEQRTSANQYRSTQAQEAAEAGLEWAVAMLNFGRITSVCIKSTSAADTSFRQRYLNIDLGNGKITPRPNPDLTVIDFTPTCVLTPAGWSCSCPETGAASLTAPTAAGVWPAFRIRFRPVAGISGSPTVPRQPLVVRAEVLGCTRLDSGSAGQCLNFDSQGVLNEGRVFISSVMALSGNAIGFPQAALTVSGTESPPAAPNSVNMSGGGLLSVFNTVTAGHGIALHAVGAATPGPTLLVQGAPGSPAATSVVENDAALGSVASGSFSASDRKFASVFNLPPESFRTQQAAVELSCPLAGCTASTLRAAISLNPLRPIWLTGDLIVDSAGDIGTAAEPVMLVINGNLQFTTPGVNVNGLVYLRPGAGSTSWTTLGSGQINGAVVSEGFVTGTGSPTIAYDASMMKFLRFNNGSFVRVPGGWKDYR